MTGKEDVHAVRLREKWDREYDTGRVAGEWWAIRLDGTGEPVGPAGTPDDLDAMIRAAEAGNPAKPRAPGTSI